MLRNHDTADQQQPNSKTGKQTAGHGAATVDLNLRDKVYRSLLGRLELRSDHLSAYERRGEAHAKAAVAFGYRSLPRGREGAPIVRDLVTEFGDDALRRVPGFYRHGADRNLSFHAAKGGYDAVLIPVFDDNDRIVTLVRHTIANGPGCPDSEFKVVQGSGSDYFTVRGRATAKALIIVPSIYEAHLIAIRKPKWRVIGLPWLDLHTVHLAAIERMPQRWLVEALPPTKFCRPGGKDNAGTRTVARARERWLKALLSLSPRTCNGKDRRVYCTVWEPADGHTFDDLLAGGSEPRRRAVPRRVTPAARTPTVAPPPPAAGGEKRLDIDSVRNTLYLFAEADCDAAEDRDGGFTLIAAPPGAGKSTTLAAAVDGRAHNTPFRVLWLTQTKEAAAEIARQAPSFTLARTREADNCERLDVVEAAFKFGHKPGADVCPSCPFRATCRYYRQADTSGPLVGAAGIARGRHLLESTDLLVLDDVRLLDLLLDTTRVSTGDLTAALEPSGHVENVAARQLLEWARSAIEHEGTSEASPLIGPLAWDALARAAHGAKALLDTIEACPEPTDFRPSRSETPQDIADAPHGHVGVIVRLLKDEARAFRRGRDFNSGLTIEAGALTIRRIRSLGGLRPEAPVVVLDATPSKTTIDVLCRALARQVSRRYAPSLTWPSGVRVLQDVRAQNGMGQVRRSEVRPGLLTEIRALIEEVQPDAPALACALGFAEDEAKALRELGLDSSRIATYYGSARAVNRIADTDLLIVVGRPAMPEAPVLAQAHAVSHYLRHSPVIADTEMRAATYKGYRDPIDGQGRQMDALSFLNPVANDIYWSSREAELTQAVGRARPFDLGKRSSLTIALLTAQPVPGVLVDELRGACETPPLNALRHSEAEVKLRAATEAMTAAGVRLSVRALAAQAGVSRGTAHHYLQTYRRTAHGETRDGEPG